MAAILVRVVSLHYAQRPVRMNETHATRRRKKKKRKTRERRHRQHLARVLSSVDRFTFICGSAFCAGVIQCLKSHLSLCARSVSPYVYWLSHLHMCETVQSHKQRIVCDYFMFVTSFAVFRLILPSFRKSKLRFVSLKKEICSLSASAS